jgi:hypothetical protein
MVEVDVPWCVHDVDRDLLCQRCGETHKLEMPISITEYVRQAKAFTELHRNCQEEKHGKS